MMSPTMGQPPRGELGPGPVLNSPSGPPFTQRFGSPGHPFGQASIQRPSLPPNASPFSGADQNFPPGVEDHSKNLNPPSNTFNQEQHVGSPSAVNGNQQTFTPNSAPRGNSSTPEVNNIPPAQQTHRELRAPTPSRTRLSLRGVPQRGQRRPGRHIVRSLLPKVVPPRVHGDDRKCLQSADTGGLRRVGVRLLPEDQGHSACVHPRAHGPTGGRQRRM
ncbi:unnamed protein product, partial [Staurois parvus]